MNYVKDWEKSARRYEAYWQGELVDRCCVAVTAPKKPAEPLPLYSPEEVLRRWTDGEWLYERWTRQFENTYYAGDAYPVLWLNLGPSGHAGYCAGAKYKLMQQNTGLSCTAWYDPVIADWEEDGLPQFDRESFLYRKTLELARYLSDRSGGGAMVSMPDTCGNLDALAHLRGSEELLMDMLDDGEMVRKAERVMQEIWETTITEVYDIVKENNRGAGCVGWLQVWAPGLMAQMQCDLSVMISPEQFGEYTMPELRSQCDFLPYPLYHFDGQEQRRHLDHLLSLEKLRVIQWTPVEGQPSPVEYLPALQRIQAAGKSLFLMLKPEEVRPIMEGLSSKGLHFSVNAETPEQADDIVRLVEKLTRE